MSEDGEKFFSDQETRDMIRRFEEMLQKNAHYYFDVDEFEEIIDYYIDKNRSSSAFDAIHHATVQHPSATGILSRKAQLLIEKGQPVEALKILKEVSRLEPSNPDLIIAQGIAYNQLGDFKSAVRQFDTGLALVMDGKAEVLHGIALSLEQVNQFKTALKYLSHAIELEPDNLLVLYDLAYCFERLEMIEKSAEYYERYLQLDPFSENVWYNLGVVYSRLNQFEKSISAYDYAIAIDDSYSSAYYNKANALANTGDYRKAIDVYKDFLLLEDDAEQVMCYLGECHEKLGEYDDALDWYRKVIRRDDRYADAWLGIAMVMYEKKNYYESLFHARKALNLEEDNQDVWFALGNIYTKLEFYKDARDAYRKTVRLDPYDFEAWANLADLYFLDKRLERAVDILVEARELNPDSALIGCRLSVCYILLGDEKNGMLFLEKACKLDNRMVEEFESYYPGHIPAAIDQILLRYRPNDSTR
jgi:tetratricopeptide (TPR) repeat protein